MGLNKEFPSPGGTTKEIIVSLGFGAFIALFLIFFEPFDLNVLTYDNKKLTLSFFGIITAIVLLIFLYFIPRTFPFMFREQHWKVKHQIIYFLIVLFVIATCNGIYINYINGLTFSWSNYGLILIRTYAIGIIPISVLTLLDQNRRLHYYRKEANELNLTDRAHIELSDEEVVISLENGKSSVRLHAEDFLYMRSEGNYIDLYRVEGENHIKSVYRSSLNSIEGQLNHFSFVRCHRSYIVNLKKVKNISGNAQGLSLELKDISASIPVSRKYLKQVRSYFKKH